MHSQSSLNAVETYRTLENATKKRNYTKISKKKYDHLRNLPMEVNLCGYKMLNEFKIFDHINLKSDLKSCVIVLNVGFNDIIYRLH